MTVIQKADQEKTFSGSKATDQAFAGFMGGAVSTLMLHPLDFLKTKLQVDETNKSVRQRLTTIPKIISDSGIRGLYRGLSPNFAGATAAWGLYFYFYTHWKSIIGGQGKLSATQHLVASALGGATTTIFTNPIFVVKTRMMTQTIDSKAYKGLLDGLKRISCEEGIRGLYRGIAPAMFGVSHGALQFMVYEQAKIYQQNQKDRFLPVFLVNEETSRIFSDGQCF